MSLMRNAAIRGVSILVACLALSSGADDGKPRPASLQEIQTIAVDPDVVMPDSLSYLSSGQLWGGAIGGAVGGAIVAGSTPQMVIKSRLDENHIDIGAIVVEEMRKALESQGHFKLVDKSEADAVAAIEVTEYGFKVAGPFRTNMHVLVRAVVTVTGKDGRVLYHRKTGSHNSEATTFAMEDFLKTPSNMSLAFHDAAALMGNTTVKSMVGRSAPTETPAEPTPAAASPAEAAPVPSAPAPSPTPAAGGGMH